MPTLSIIIPACNERETIGDVVVSCKRLDPLEIIVVANGCTDGTDLLATQLGCTVIVEETPLGNDVGRALGAAHARGDIMLFLDADFAIDADTLRVFLEPILHGHADVVLNNFEKLFTKKQIPHPITVWRQVVNELARRTDLRIDSILSVPHALTKEAVKKIGLVSLANPIEAHVRCMKEGSRIANSVGIDVTTPNKFRPMEHGMSGQTLSRADQRMIGDHLAVLSLLGTGPRGGVSDGGRRRDIVSDIVTGKREVPVVNKGFGYEQSGMYQGKQLSVIIPVQNEEATIGEIIQQLRFLEPKEIIVVVNGSTDHTADMAAAKGATVIQFAEPLGNDSGRAIGAKYATGDILLFLDGDFVIPSQDLFPFVTSVATGTDIALNDLNYYLGLRHPLHIVTASKYAVNLAMGRKDLGIGSFVAVPFAMSRSLLEKIGFGCMESPVLAQVKGMLAGAKTACVHRVEVDQLNRIRPDQHFAKTGYPKATERIIGDHLEGLYYLVAEKGPRGGFHDGDRQWHKLDPYK